MPFCLVEKKKYHLLIQGTFAQPRLFSFLLLSLFLDDLFPEVLQLFRIMTTHPMVSKVRVLAHFLKSNLEVREVKSLT